MITLSRHRGAYSVKALDISVWETDLGEGEAEEVLKVVGVSQEEIDVAFGLIESGSHKTVDFDAQNQAIIEDEYGEIIEENL